MFICFVAGCTTLVSVFLIYGYSQQLCILTFLYWKPGETAILVLSKGIQQESENVHLKLNMQGNMLCQVLLNLSLKPLKINVNICHFTED